MQEHQRVDEETLPSLAASREHSVDILRGVALLGILLMNIVVFAYPIEAYQSPVAPGLERYTGEFTGVNAAIWWFCHVFVDLKMMSVFAMLFGGGVVLMARSRPDGFAGMYYRRLLFLGVVGFIHGFAIWFGDILLSYSICGLLLYPARNLKPRTLAVLGVVAAVVPIAVSFGVRALMRRTGEYGDDNPFDNMTADDTVRLVRSGLGGSLGYNIGAAIVLQVITFVMFTSGRALGMMLVGMALMKIGFFTGRWSVKSYVTTAILGYMIGLPIVLVGAGALERRQFALEAILGWPGQGNYIGSIPMAIAHASVVIALARHDGLRRVMQCFAAVGRTAFSNYLLTSLVMTAIFYGWGLGLFARFERPTLYLFVLGMWLAQLIISNVWVRWFRYGMMEWLWRSFTNLAWQPMLK